MANKTGESRRSTRNPWVPAGINGGNGSAAGSAGAGQTEQWLPVQRPARRNGNRAQGNGRAPENGSTAVASEGGAKPTPRGHRRRRHKLPKRASPRERWL